MMRRAVMLGLATLLAACGRKSDPLPPSGADTPRRSYPPPEPAPTRTGMRLPSPSGSSAAADLRGEKEIQTRIAL
jgi:hypothetical protein